MQASLLLALAAVAPRAPAQNAAPAPRSTLVRVVGAGGQGLVGARVVFYSSPFGVQGVQYGDSMRVLTTGERGKLRAALDPAKPWWVWAVHDDGKKRVATPAQRVELGRPLVLEPTPFPVPFVRIVGLAPWREVFGGALRLRFVGQGEPSPAFDVALPEGDAPVLRIPPLPNANYYPCLVDAKGGFLDGRYFSQTFHEGDPSVEPVYEREYPLKKVLLGVPIELRLRVVDEEGAPVPGARALVRPFYSGLRAERAYDCDAQGEASLVVGWRKQETRGWFTHRVIVLASGRVAVYQDLIQPPPKVYGPKRVMTVALGPADELAWTIDRGASEGALLLASLDLRSTKSPGGVLHELVPLRVGARGELELPRPTKWAQGVGALQVHLVGPRETLPLAILPSGKLPKGRRLSPARLGRVDLALVDARDRPVRSSRLTLVALDRAGKSLFPVLPRIGAGARGGRVLRLPAGRYRLVASGGRHGDAIGDFEVVARETRAFRLALAKPWLLSGRVLDAEGKSVAGVQVSFALQRVRSDIELVRQAILPGLAPVETDAAGNFELRVSSFALEVSVMAMRQLEGRQQWGNTLAAPETADEVEITLQG